MADKKMVKKARENRLLLLARETIGYRLGQVSEVDRDGLEEDFFKRECGTFVTLKINNQLRGCIGNIEPSGTIVEAVSRNALSSAFHDYRFSPLGAEEFSEIRIDISILTVPEELHYRDSDELISILNPGKDGVILGIGKNKATFLPQVWDQLPTPQLFLEHLCVKAGLPADAWKTRHPEILIYQVDCFGEEDR